MLLYWSSVIAGLASAVGCAYLVCAMLMTSRFPRRSLPAARESMPRVTILKPLHGAEPGLLENLTSFCTQNYPGAVQIVFDDDESSPFNVKRSVKWRCFH